MNKKIIALLLAVTALALLLLIPRWSAKLIGQRPVKEVETRVPNPEISHSLEALRRRVVAAPADITLKKQLAAELEKAFRLTGGKELLFEEMEVRADVLKLDPADSESNLKLAEISFNNQVFDKAIKFYEAYLASHPDDAVVRPRYASALIFSGQFEEALRELDSVLKSDPNNFSALAFKSIALSQLGKTSEAEKVGELALRLAPDEEGRKRFARYLESLGAGIAPVKKSKEDSDLEGYLKNNPVAGPKFKKIESTGSVLKIYFTDFPVESMPPFVRDKFIGEIKRRLPTGISKLSLVDEASNRPMFEVDLKK